MKECEKSLRIELHRIVKLAIEVVTDLEYLEMETVEQELYDYLVDNGYWKGNKSND